MFNPSPSSNKAPNSDKRADLVAELTDLFFMDYDLTPLFVQEHYPIVRPFTEYRPPLPPSLLPASQCSSLVSGSKSSSFTRIRPPPRSDTPASASTRRHLLTLAHTAGALARSDSVQALIRSKQLWSLLPTQAMFATVLPGHYVRGSIGGMISFPQHLGTLCSIFFVRNYLFLPTRTGTVKRHKFLIFVFVLKFELYNIL